MKGHFTSFAIGMYLLKIVGKDIQHILLCLRPDLGLYLKCSILSSVCPSSFTSHTFCNGKEYIYIFFLFTGGGGGGGGGGGLQPVNLFHSY